MAISAFPASLVPIIQTGFLDREFEEGLMSRLGYRVIADRETFPNRIGETITKTRAGLKPPVTTALTPSSNTNFDNGLSPTTWSVEQYVLSIFMYGDTIDLNTVTQKVGIADQAMRNARVNGIQAAQSLDRLARNALFFGPVNGFTNIGGYLGGNTRVITTLGAAGTTIHVDDIRGFTYSLNTVDQQVVTSGSYGLSVVVGADVYTLVAAAPDGTNISTAPLGISGTLTFSGNVTVLDGTAGNAVVASTAPVIIRPNARATVAGLTAPTGTYNSTNYVPGDTLLLDCINQAVATLRMNNVPPVEASGMYHCYLDDHQLMGLFRDNDFKLLYRGAYGSDTYRSGQIIDLLGVRFITTTEAPQQASLGAGAIHRAIVCGQGAIIEGDFEGIASTEEIPDAERALIRVIDSVAQVTREPLDRLKQIIAQSWYWIGGFALPTDATATSSIIPTATSSYLKRAVVVETL